MTRLSALISGANRGIGFAIAKGLAEKGVSVYVGSRNQQAGEDAIAPLKAAGGDVQVVQLDTTDPKSVADLAKWFSDNGKTLDILVNNAGIALDFDVSIPAEERIARTLDVNVIGTTRLTEAMIPFLAKSDHARIVNVSSELASFGLRHDPTWVHKDIKLPTYAATKAAVNALTVSYADLLADQGIKVHAICPGLTATEATNFNGRPVDEAAKIAIDTALLTDSSITGTFANDAGTIPW